MARPAVPLETLRLVFRVDCPVGYGIENSEYEDLVYECRFCPLAYEDNPAICCTVHNHRICSSTVHSDAGYQCDARRSTRLRLGGGLPVAQRLIYVT